ncbi:MAG: undecaprenyldiphospho-muramoylpentapeptide beta-N-acetylglucosaminyltransferase [Acutalibacteraceae bacterium]|jgi:UDP-N-acetylglucosamine--N-acetylmuramyl-(pentapeptide) pyrophosphoryl-undecaprenol N-acetylglucosamine transferase
MRVLMTGGGTAGHINPALAIADKIKAERPDAEILFVGAKGRMETVLVPKAGYPIRTIDVQGFQRRLSVKNIGRNVKAAVHAVTSGFSAGRIIKDFRPDIAIGTGGYVSGPVLRKAAKMGIPVLTHESNALPGVTVKMLARYAAATMVANEAARRHLPDDVRVVITGNPLRPGFVAADREQARRELGLDERPLVLSFGGSLGAPALNEAMLYVMEKSAADGGIQHIHAVGKAAGAYPAFCRRMTAKGLPLDKNGFSVREYIDDMPRCMAAADLVICRCGAMTLSELPAAGKPSILIPSPYVAENHQYHNAMALVNRGAARCIEEKDLTGESLWAAVRELVTKPDTLSQMGDAARRAAILDADERIWRVIREVLGEKE